MVLYPVKGGFAIQVKSHAVQLIYPWPLAHRPVVAFVSECGANDDLPKAHEKHEQGVVVPEVKSNLIQGGPTELDSGN